MVKYVNSGRWSTEEHNKFLEARISKMKWEETSAFIGTRSADQCRSHNQKMKIKKYQKESWLCMSKPKMIDKCTQYEVPPSVFADKPVYPKDFEIGSSNTKDSDMIDDFELIDLESDDFLV